MCRKSRPLTLDLPHHRTKPAKKVLVTGTFDNWAGSQALDKVGDVFEKTVRIENTGDKVHYKVSGSFLSFFLFWVIWFARAICAFNRESYPFHLALVSGSGWFDHGVP